MVVASTRATLTNVGITQALSHRYLLLRLSFMPDTYLSSNRALRRDRASIFCSLQSPQRLLPWSDQYCSFVLVVRSRNTQAPSNSRLTPVPVHCLDVIHLFVSRSGYVHAPSCMSQAIDGPFGELRVWATDLMQWHLHQSAEPAVASATQVIKTTRSFSRNACIRPAYNLWDFLSMWAELVVDLCDCRYQAKLDHDIQILASEFLRT